MNWKELLEFEKKRDYYKRLKEFVTAQQLRKDIRILPEKDLIFNALKLTPLEKVKVVILGQDPYPTFGQAHGLAFSVPNGHGFPGSLSNIFKEVSRSLNVRPKDSTDLTRWTEQGVLLLNAILTVQEGRPSSHTNKGWEEFTDRVIEVVNKEQNIVFLLWGNYAKAKGNKIDRKRHLVLTAPHPSPLARGFVGCNHFRDCNTYLKEHGKEPIDWR